MYQLTYYSKAVKNISSKDIKDILNVSINNNQSNQLTGCLVFIKNTFIQILEGDQLKIENLYEKLLLDKRHTNVMLISKGISDRRFFPEWGMAYYPVSDDYKKDTESQQFQRNLDLLLDLSQPRTEVEKQFWIMVKIKLSQNRMFFDHETK